MRIRSSTSRHSIGARRRRSGSAAVELVMAIPLLAMLLALLLTIGAAGTARLEVAVAARRAAWTAARQGVSSRPLRFESAGGDLQTTAQSQPLGYALPRLGLGDAEAELCVLRGTWDHRELLRDSRDLHFNDLKKVGGGAGQLQSALSLFQSSGSDLRGVAGQFSEQAAEQLLTSAAGVDMNKMKSLEAKANKYRAKFEAELKKGLEVAEGVILALKGKSDGGKSSNPLSPILDPLTSAVEALFTGDFKKLGDLVKNVRPDEIPEAIRAWTDVKEIFSGATSP